MLNRFAPVAVAVISILALATPSRAQVTNDQLKKSIDDLKASVDKANAPKPSGAVANEWQTLAAIYPCPPGCCYPPYSVCLAPGDRLTTFNLIKTGLGIPATTVTGPVAGDPAGASENKLISVALKSKTADDLLKDKRFGDYVKDADAVGAAFIFKKDDKTVWLVGRSAVVDTLKLAVTLYDGGAVPAPTAAKRLFYAPKKADEILKALGKDLVMKTNAVASGPDVIEIDSGTPNEMDAVAIIEMNAKEYIQKK